MTLHKNPRCILITGATGGIGGALAPAYAAPGVTLILQGRRTERLEEMAEQCRAAGARVILHALDVQDLVAVREWITHISEIEQPDLIIVGAGVEDKVLASTGRSMPPVLISSMSVAWPYRDVRRNGALSSTR